MKKALYTLMLLLLACQMQAATLYDQLCAFNFNWKDHADQAPAGAARHFATDRDYVQAHLACVLPILRSNPTGHLNAAQRQSRRHMIHLLEGYREAGRFPINYYRASRVPVFIDEHNTHCAVAYLMQQTGHEGLARTIAAADNYAWVKDIHVPGLCGWQQESGLSVDELKLIQGAYDSYLNFAWTLPNKYEIPQKPEVVTRFFEDGGHHVWVRGEGSAGVLNGRWEQNYAAGIPWIEGYYENGKRTGQWKEYYQGTAKLCRTECWRNDKLNGVRRRFSMDGKLTEEILFRDGKAVTKTNYDYADSLTWVRKPLDAEMVWTEVYTFGGALLATGHEKIYNPGNLQWFQNIELTALNMAAVTVRDVESQGSLNAATQQFSGGSFDRNTLYNSPPLVQYRKEGEWKYYKEHDWKQMGKVGYGVTELAFLSDYRHFGSGLYHSVSQFDGLRTYASYDSLCIVYADDNLQEFHGFGDKATRHFQINYYQPDSLAVLFVWPGYKPVPQIRTLGEYTSAREKTGVWKHFDASGRMYKTENYIIPRKDDEDAKETGSTMRLD